MGTKIVLNRKNSKDEFGILTIYKNTTLNHFGLEALRFGL